MLKHLRRWRQRQKPEESLKFVKIYEIPPVWHFPVHAENTPGVCGGLRWVWAPLTLRNLSSKHILNLICLMDLDVSGACNLNKQGKHAYSGVVDKSSH